MLLHVSWLLALAAALLGAVLLGSRSAENEVATSIALAREDLAYRSAANIAIYKMLSASEQSTPMGEGKLVDEEANVGGLRLRIIARAGEGLLDLGFADMESVRRLVSALYAAKAGKTSQAIQDRRESSGPGRPFSAYREVIAGTPLDADEFLCLHRLSTLFSEMREPDARVAPRRLVSVLNLATTSTQSVISDEKVGRTRTARIEVFSAAPRQRSRFDALDIAVTGRIDIPFLIRSSETFWRLPDNC